MPAITAKSRIKALSDHYSLTLTVHHRLAAGFPSDTTHCVTKTRLPEKVDVVAGSSLTLTLTGSLDGSTVSPKTIKESRLAVHLVEYFRMNASELGLSTVSEVQLDDETGLPTVFFTFSHIFNDTNERLGRVTLVGLDLHYGWKTIESSESVDEGKSHPSNHPFSNLSSLPFLSLLDNAVGRFATWHLVRRYPLVFGSWCQQLRVEQPFFDCIFESVSNIIQRSRNPHFRSECRKLLNTIRRLTEAAGHDASVSLSSYLESVAASGAVDNVSPRLSERTAFSISMENLYRYGLRQPLFKGLTHIPVTNDDSDDELSQEHFHNLPCDVNIHATQFSGSNSGLEDIPYSSLAPTPTSLSRISSPIPDSFMELSRMGIKMAGVLDTFEAFDSDDEFIINGEVRSEPERQENVPGIDISANASNDVTSAQQLQESTGSTLFSNLYRLPSTPESFDFQDIDCDSPVQSDLLQDYDHSDKNSWSADCRTSQANNEKLVLNTAKSATGAQSPTAQYLRRLSRMANSSPNHQANKTAIFQCISEDSEENICDVMDFQACNEEFNFDGLYALEPECEKVCHRSNDMDDFTIGYQDEDRVDDDLKDAAIYDLTASCNRRTMLNKHQQDIPRCDTEMEDFLVLEF